MNNQDFNILIVDDNSKNLQLLGKILQEQHYRIAVAKGGLAAIDIATRINPHLILLDIMMPEMDGYEVCEKLKTYKQFKDTPVIFITAKTELTDLVKAFQVGGVDYITKPFKKEELLVRVETQLSLVQSKIIINKQNKTLEEIIKSREQLYSIIAHDLRSPLGSIKMSLQALLGNKIPMDSGDAKELMASLLQTTSETSDLLDNLLLWSKNKTSSLQVHFEANSIKVILDQIAKLFQLKIQEKNINLEFDVPAESIASADSIMLTTIIRNLISNALKFTNIGGQIKVYTEEKDENILIHVKDSGIGMSPEEIEKLFHSNTHFTKFGTNNEKGSGLGLLLCKDFALKNNGDLKVISEQNVGSTFILSLPKYE